MDDSHTGTPPDTVLPDEGCLHQFLDIPPERDCAREGYPSHRDPLTYDSRAGKNGPHLPQVCSQSTRPILDQDSEELSESLTVHKVLQDMSSLSRVGRKYDRRNRPATTKPASHDERCHSVDCNPAPTPCYDQVEIRNHDQCVSAFPRIQSKRVARRETHLRRKKQFTTKSLGQRLFEADVFSSGTSSRPTSVRNPAHISTRRPLQFVTSLNLTPSLERRMYQPRRRKLQEEERKGSHVPVQADSGILEASNLNPAQETSWDRPATEAASGKRFSNRTWTRNRHTKPRERTGGSAPALASGRRAQAFRGHDRKQGTAREPPTSPFEYGPLPLVWVKNAAGSCVAPAHSRATPTGMC